MRPSPGDYHTGQHCRSGKPGDHPYPPRWLRPAAELGHTL